MRTGSCSLLALVLALTACAADIHARFPNPQPTSTGALVLLISEPATGVSVAIDGVLVVQDAHTDHVVIEDIPVGPIEVILSANGSDKQFKAWIQSDHPTTVPLGVPDASAGFIKTLAGTLITILVYSWLHH